MTCIVGVKTRCGRVVIAGDSAGVGGLSLSVRADPKVFMNGEIAFGCTSSFRMIQLLRFGLVVPPFEITVPTHPGGLETYEWAVRKLVPAIRSCLKEGGFAGKKDEVESGGQFLVGVRGRLFGIHNDYQVSESIYGFEACGCGFDLALGALASKVGLLTHDQKEALPSLSLAGSYAAQAIEIAERFSAGVRGPIQAVTTPIHQQEENRAAADE